MRIPFFLIMSFIGIVTFSFAQGPTGHWVLGGNLGVPPPNPDAVTAANNTLGTLTNLPINFATNNLQRMRLTETGRLGLGTIAPSAVLGIDGTALNTGDVFRTDAPTTATTFWRMFRGGIEAGNIFNITGDIHFRIQAMQSNSAVLLSNRVGIGAFVVNSVIPSILTVNGDLPFNGTGEVFRTDAPTNQNTFWRMFRGGQEMGSLYNMFGDNHFRIQSMTIGSDLVFHTSYNDVMVGPVTAANSTERMRISSALFPTAAGLNVTRIAISEIPGTPIIIPRSLLHLGFNAVTNGGWRSWMDVGTFISAGTDNMYIGLKDEDPLATSWSDQQSAIISWGNNPQSSLPPDKLRFVFTSQQGLPTNLPSASQNGLEVARMVSDGNTGRMGIGDFFTNAVDPLNALEIRSNPTFGDTRSGLRLTNLTALVTPDAANTTNVLSVNDMGDVILVENRGGINECANAIALTGNSGIQLNGNNFYFTGQDADFDKIGVGVSCGNTMLAKLQVENTVTDNILTTPITGAFINSGNATTGNVTVAVFGYSKVSGSLTNIGGVFTAISTDPSPNWGGVGVLAQGSGGAQPVGGLFVASNSSKETKGISAYSFGGDFCTGGDFHAGTGKINYGIHASLANFSGITGPNDYAGLFNGRINVAGTIINGSDKNLKENITSIVDALGMLSNVKPSKFNFKTTPYMALPSGTQYGVIAQDLQNILPNLVSDVIFPEVIDTAGNVLHPSQTWKGVNYIGLIPIAIQGIKELDLKILKATLSDTQLKQNVQPLQNSLSVINQLNGVSYNWNPLIDTTLELPTGTEIGLIAQSVEAVIPEVIFTDNKGYKHIEYQKIVPILIEANKELQDSLTTLKNQLATLAIQVAAIQDCMDNLPVGAGCNGSHARTINPTNNNNTASLKESQKVTLESSDMAILYQNEPNPFSNNTTIRYYLPSDVNEAVMVFHDEYGREINREILSSKGYAQIGVESEKLAAGIYTYSSVIVGKVFETKKMIKVRN